MSDLFTNILFPLSTGGAGGFLIGYATKKIVKILMFFLGLCSLFLFYLVHIEVIDINSDKLAEATSSLLAQTAGFLSATIAYLPFSGSFVAGFALGIMKG
jgi:uncharacterized membrane protein (Fun14 family)